MYRPRLAISFSGGRSSAVMTKLCLEEYGATHEIVVTFANTGCEHSATWVRQVLGFGTELSATKQQAEMENRLKLT